MFILKKVVIEVVEDDNPDLSYLQQEYEGISDDGNERYKAETAARLESYLEDWHMVGVRATAILYHTYNQKTATVHRVTTAGAYGYEVEYTENTSELLETRVIRETVEDQIADLKIICSDMGIPADEFDRLSAQAQWREIGTIPMHEKFRNVDI